MRALAFAAALCALAGCNRSTKNLCAGDLSCQPGFSCDPATGACRCASDSSCQPTESCNEAGFCQPRLRCRGTSDCAPGSICDTVSGVCIAAGTCDGLDVQCKAGEVCKDFTCVPGCRKSGDCAASTDVCRPCPPGTPAAQCPVGNRCVRGRCDTQLTCHYGDTCAPDGADASGDKVCTPDTRGPYCQPCARSGGSTNYCQDPASYCLIDTSVPFGQAFYCGVDCSQGQSCPNGYRCRDVRIVRAQNCEPKAGLSACPAVAGSIGCDPAKNRAGAVGGIVNDDCESAVPSLAGAVCDPATRKCVPQCLGTGETGIQAFCSCLQDSDCPQDQCDSATRACVISGKPCFLSPDSCRAESAIRCVKVTDARLGAVGICRIGQNCAPNEGFTCEYLRTH